MGEQEAEHELVARVVELRLVRVRVRDRVRDRDRDRVRIALALALALTSLPGAAHEAEARPGRTSQEPSAAGSELRVRARVIN